MGAVLVVLAPFLIANTIAILYWKNGWLQQYNKPEEDDE